MATGLNIDEVVRQRYEAGAVARQDSLCCPVSYDPRYLEVIPREVIERDYGCGYSTPYLQPGDTVLDLGERRRQDVFCRGADCRSYGTRHRYRRERRDARACAASYAGSGRKAGIWQRGVPARAPRGPGGKSRQHRPQAR